MTITMTGVFKVFGGLLALLGTLTAANFMIVLIVHTWRGFLSC